MLRSFPNGETLILNRRVATGQTDDYGVQQYQISARTITGVAVWPTTSNEVADGTQDRTSTNYTVALPDSIEVSAIDSVLWRGRQFEVIGPPEHLRSPITGNGLQTLLMSCVEG